MIKNILKKNRGSTFIIVIISISVLSILGTAIISLGLMNYKMNVLNKKEKTSFYLAEAGLEEAYGIMAKVVEEGIKKGNENVQTELTAFIEYERARENEEDSTYNSPYINSDGSVNDKEIKEDKYLDKWFIQGYIAELNKTENEYGTDVNVLEKKLKDKSYAVLDSSLDSKRPTVTIKSLTEYNITEINNEIDNLLSTDKNNFPQNLIEKDDLKFKIELLSEFNYEKVKKNIESEFDLCIPKYDTPYYIETEVVKLKENVLWTKALLSNKDIIVTGTDVIVNGDIYAYGDQANSVEDRGIMVGKESKAGKLTVNGKVITDGYFQTKAKDSIIDITGDVYSNSLVVPELDEDADDENCKITVNGDVNTIDDIELNGEKSIINIQGSYYGFSDGSSNSKTHKESSSIVINSDDIQTDSKLIISGTGKGKEYYKRDGDLGDGVFISGTVFIDLLNSYQTGESVSVKGNYKAYSVKLSEGVYAEDNVVFEYEKYAPLILMERFNTSTNRLYEDRKAYIIEVSDKKPGELKLGNGNIDIKNVRYSIGAYIDKVGMKGSPTVAGYYMDALTKNLREYNYYTRKMGDPQISDYTDGVNDVNTKVNIEDFINFTEDINEIKDKEAFIVNSDTNKNIYIKGSGSSDASSNFQDIIINEGGKLKGIIVTKGDVHISGKLDYTGTIVAGGNIYIDDDAKKVFSNDYNTNFKGNYIVNKVVENMKGKGNKIGDLFEQKDAWKENDEGVISTSDIGMSSDIKTYYKFSDLIDISKWKKVKQ